MAVTRSNYEFVLYGAVVLGAVVAVLAAQSRVRFESGVLWGLSLWGLLHMAGGNVRVGEGILYEVQLVPVVLRYDQLVHFIGFGVATLVCHHLLRVYLRDGVRMPWMLAVLVVMMGTGVGALNEIVEFVAVLTIPETGVGGYGNTLWDLVFNLFGATTAAVYLSVRERRRAE
jgi:putative membrane protein